MPDPSKYETEDDWMDACVSRMVDEGKEQKQAVAACLNMWRNKEVDEAVTGWQQLKNLFKEKPMKTVDGKKYPSSDFLVVEDSASPSTWHLPVKRNGKPDHGLMGAAKAALTSAGGHRGNRYQGPGKEQAVAKLKRLYEAEGMEWGESKEKDDNRFMVWKEADGSFRWLAIYSNKFRDDDLPPEIISEAAHKEFVRVVDEGQWPFPELRLWHVKGTTSGAADFVAYDDRGFALASGTVTNERVAKALMDDDDLLTSHGMPVGEIRRDTDDPSIITRYRSIEISPLPSWAAANRHTGFTTLKEADMSLPKEKRDWLVSKLGEEAVVDLEAGLGEKAKEAEGLEFKEQEEPGPVEPTVSEVKEEAAPEAAPAPAPEYVTADEVAEAVGAHLKPLREQLAVLLTTIEALGKEVKELKRSDDAKIKQLVEETPAASLYERIGSVIGAPEAVVDGRTELAKAKPRETAAAGDGPTLVPWLNEMIAKNKGVGG